jgi:maltose alpha-D-glucosyltransferase/alpha-amylase
MVRSIYNVAYEGFLATTHAQNEEIKSLLPFADFWAHYMSNFFIKAYIDKVRDGNFLPEEQEDLEVMLQTFLLENALRFFNQELNRDPKKAVIPLRIIKTVINPGSLRPEEASLQPATTS